MHVSCPNQAIDAQRNAALRCCLAYMHRSKRLFCTPGIRGLLQPGWYSLPALPPPFCCTQMMSKLLETPPWKPCLHGTSKARLFGRWARCKQLPCLCTAGYKQTCTLWLRIAALISRAQQGQEGSGAAGAVSPAGVLQVLHDACVLAMCATPCPAAACSGGGEGNHWLSGPIWVCDAAPGDVLQVRGCGQYVLILVCSWHCNARAHQMCPVVKILTCSPPCSLPPKLHPPCILASCGFKQVACL